MNIIWLTPQFPSSLTNIKGIYIYRTVKELSKYFDIYVICLYPATPPFVEMIKYWKDWKRIYSDWKINYTNNSSEFMDFGNGKIIYLRYFRLPRGKYHHIEGWFSYFQARKQLSKIVNSQSIIHANWIFPAGTMASIISKKYKVPFIVSLMGSDVNRLVKGTKFWRAAKKILYRADKITAVTEDLFEKCSDKKMHLDNSKIMQIDNIYESDRFIVKDRKYCRKLLNIDLNKKVIFFAGGLIPVKNVDILIEAFDILLNEGNDALLYLAGSGTEEGNIRRMIEMKGITNKVFLLGPLQSKDLINYFNSADLFCLPSKSEGMPNVVIESLFCGTPVVASNVGGIPTLIKDAENGFLVPRNKKKLLAKAIEKSFNTVWNREIIRKSVSHLSKDKIIAKYKVLYKEVSAKGSG